MCLTLRQRRNQNSGSECNHGKGTQALLIRLQELLMPHPAQPLGDQAESPQPP